MTQRQIEYRQFLDSQFWKDLRHRKFKESGRKCRHCGTTKGVLQCHHVQYPSDWYKTELYHLIVLCLSCHRKCHPEKNGKQFKKRKIKKKDKRKLSIDSPYFMGPKLPTPVKVKYGKDFIGPRWIRPEHQRGIEKSVRKNFDKNQKIRIKYRDNVIGFIHHFERVFKSTGIPSNIPAFRLYAIRDRLSKEDWMPSNADVSELQRIVFDTNKAIQKLCGGHDPTTVSL